MSSIQDWSTTAASNTSIDGINIAENCSPANLNNSDRSIMANVAALRNLNGGAATTGGSGNTQTLTSGLTLLAYQQGLLIGFEAGFTNTGATTLNIDGLGAKNVKTQAGDALSAGMITAGGIYLVAYETSADCFYLIGAAPTDFYTTAEADAAFQPKDATLTGLAGLGTGANKVPMATGTDTFTQIDFKDEDNMASDSATAVPSQQSVKAYVDAADATKMAVPSTSAFPIGFCGIMEYTNAASVAANGTTSGSNIKTPTWNDSAFQVGNGAAQSGTWKNVSGGTQDANAVNIGYWLRTA